MLNQQNIVNVKMLTTDVRLCAVPGHDTQTPACSKYCQPAAQSRSLSSSFTNDIRYLHNSVMQIN